MRVLWANLQKKYKLLAAASLIVAVSSAATVGVMAAIPDSVTRVISACRNNSNGSLKAIDAQANSTCGSSETLLTWPSSVPKTAVARIIVNPDPDRIDATGSRDILDFKVIPEADGNPAIYCIKVGFAPRVALLADPSSNFGFNASPGNADVSCGAGGYNVVASGSITADAVTIYVSE